MTVTALDTVVDKFFDADRLNWDVRDGTVRAATGNRHVYLSTDLIRGMYTAIEYETGEAWRLVLKTCGKRWGQRLVTTLDAELHQATGKHLGELPMTEWVDFIQAWFAENGWGQMRIDLKRAQRDGVVLLHLDHSLFVAAIPEVGDRADALLEGVLSAIFSAASGTEVDVIEASCTGRGDAQCIFIASGPDRIEALEEPIENRAPVHTLIEAVCGH